jgi:tRNA threonylcarbamoyl adenosine modification protein YeaZ
VGLVTAAAIADALGLPAYPVCSLDAIGLAAATQSTSGDLLVAADARRREVYWATYRDGRRLTEPAVGKPAELGLRVAAMAGAGARLYAEVLGFPLLNADDSDSLDYPGVQALAQLASADVLAGLGPAPLTPLYLRRPDAVAATSVKSVSQ